MNENTAPTWVRSNEDDTVTVMHGDSEIRTLRRIGDETTFEVEVRASILASRYADTYGTVFDADRIS